MHKAYRGQLKAQCRLFVFQVENFSLKASSIEEFFDLAYLSRNTREYPRGVIGFSGGMQHANIPDWT